MRYKFTLMPVVRDYVASKIRYYPEDKKQLAELKIDMIPSPTPKYERKESNGGSNPEQRPTEDITFRITSNSYIARLEFEVKAIESVLNVCSKEDIELIRLTYWNGELTPEGIALKLNIERSTYYRRLNDLLVAFAERMGLFSGS